MRASLPKADEPKIILGLCNPDEEYQSTYHNVGGMFIDFLAKQRDLNFKKGDFFKYAKSRGLIITKSLTYMNESGIAAKAVIKYFKTPKEELIVAHDDSDLTLGNFKITTGQNAAGHHGIESLINELKTKNFSRIRIGVRPAVEKRRMKAGDFVLKKISRDNLKVLEETFSKICDELDLN